MAYGTALQQRLFHAMPPPVKNLMATLYGWREKRQRQGLHFHRCLAELRQSQWHSPAESAALQLELTRVYLRYAARHSEYYARLFAEYQFEPDALTEVSQLAKLPLLDKQQLRRDTTPFLSNETAALNPRWVQTSGTTGTPLRFPLSAECFQREYAFRYLHYEWGGIHTGQRMAFCAGHPVTYHDRTRPPFWTYDRANRWLLMSSYHLTRHNLPAYIEQLTAFRPSLLAGYPSSLYLLALANRAAGSPVRPQGVYASSETILSFQREAIEAAFGCKLYGWYGTGEMCANIVECEQGNYHLRPEHSLVEVVTGERPAQPGETGRLLCTGFGNRALLLIRYDIGDEVELASLESCPCGRGGTIVKQVFGRTEDYIVTPDGRLVGRLDHLFKDSTNVIQAQLVQSDPAAVLIRIVPAPEYIPADERIILTAARERLGGAIRIAFEYVDDIPRTANGKFRFIDSSLSGETLLNSLTH